MSDFSINKVKKRRTRRFLTQEYKARTSFVKVTAKRERPVPKVVLIEQQKLHDFLSELDR